MIKSLPENIAEIDQIADKLRKVKVGEVITYSELNALVTTGRVQTKSRYKLDSALTRLVKQDSIVFGCIIGEGLKRLNDSETAKIGDQTRKKIGGAAKRGLRKMHCANAGLLSVVERNRLFATQSLLGAVINLSKSSSVKEMENVMPHEKMKLLLTKTIQSFS